MVQAWILVMIFDGWLLPFIPELSQHQVMAIEALAVYVMALFGVMLLRALIGYAKDALLTRIGVQAASDVRQRLLVKLGDMGPARRFLALMVHWQAKSLMNLSISSVMLALKFRKNCR